MHYMKHMSCGDDAELCKALTLCLPLQVEKLARQFGVAEDVAYTCETAAHFWLLHVLSRWEKFLAQAQQKKTPECVKVWPPAKLSHTLCL